MEKPKGILARLLPFLRYVEMGSLIAIGVGFLFLYQGSTAPGSEFIMVGFTALATVYYLYAYIPAPSPSIEVEIIEPKPDSKKSIIDLLPLMLRKVLYVASSVCLIGILFSILHLSGSGIMMLIGVSASAICTVAAIALILRDGEALTSLQGPLIRAVPIAAYGINWLREFWPF